MTETPRPGHLHVLRTILPRWERGESHTAISVATRYGKSDIARAAILLGIQQGLITCGLVLSPTSFLVKQMVRADKWAACLDRFNAEWLTANGFPAITFTPKYSRLPKLKVRPNAGGQHFLSASIQLIVENVDIFCDWAESVLHQTGRPVAIFMDESHTGSEANKWGAALERLAAAGALIVWMTATPERPDGKRIPGFKFDKLNPKRTEVYVPTSISDEMVRVDVYEGIKSRLILMPDAEVSFRQAFDESALAHVNFDTFDVDLSEVAGDSFSGKLSALPVSRVPSVLEKVTRNPTVIRAACEKLIMNVRWYRATNPRHLGIVYTGNDDERHGARPGDNQHPEMVKAEILRQDPSLRVVILTSQDDEAEDHLMAFCDGGYGDIAIVKQMGGLGLDSDLLKVGLDLSNVRTYPATVQRMMRIATPPPLMGTYIAPADLMMRAIFQRVVANEGGEVTTSDLHLVNSFEVPKKPKTPEGWQIGESAPGDFSDSQLYHGTGDQRPAVQQFFISFPAVRGIYSDAYIASHLGGLSVEASTAKGGLGPARDIGAEADALRVEINSVADDATKFRIQQGEADFGKLRGEIFGIVYRATGWPYGTKLDELDDIDLLTAVRDEMQQVRLRVLKGDL